MNDKLIAVYERQLFEEIGKTISKATEAKLRAALDAIQALLGDEAASPDVTQEAWWPEKTESTIDGAISALEEAMSQNELQSAVQKAIKAKYSNAYHCWIRDIWPDDGYVIYELVPMRRVPVAGGVDYSFEEERAQYYRADFTAKEDGTAEIVGEPTKVNPKTVFVPVKESDDEYELTDEDIEAAAAVLDADGEDLGDEDPVFEEAKGGGAGLANVVKWLRKSGGEHPHGACVAKFKGKVSDPDRFCAAAVDKMKGTTKWRGPDKKMKASDPLAWSEPAAHEFAIDDLAEAIEAFDALDFDDTGTVEQEALGDVVKKVVDRAKKLVRKAKGDTGKKYWKHESAEAPCDDCKANMSAGKIALDETFPFTSGEYLTHPNCHCVVFTIAEDGTESSFKAAGRKIDGSEVGPSGSDSPETLAASGDIGGLVGDLVPLAESAVRKDGTVMLKIIQPGWGSSGYYSEDVLKRDGPKVFKAGLHMYADHPTKTEAKERPERSVLNLAGVLTEDAKWYDNGPNGEGKGLYAHAKPLGVMEGVVETLAPHIGVSWRGYGKQSEGLYEGRKGFGVEQLAVAQSVDWVTKAGAGGKVVQMAESARAGTPLVANGSESETLAESSSGPDNGPGEVAHVSVDEQALKEAQDAISALTSRLDAMAGDNARLTESLALRDGEVFLTNALAKIQLPDVTRTRLHESLKNRVPVVEGKVDIDEFQKLIDAAVLAESNYVAALSGGGRIRGMGETTREVQEADDKALKERAANAFKRLNPSISEGVATRGLVG